MFVIDFDDTLFDTDAFKQARGQALTKFNVPEDLYWQVYRETRNSSSGRFTYSNRRHAKELSKYGYDESAIFNALDAVCQPNELRKFLINDAEVLLDTLKSLKHSLILLSLGDPDFQELKVKGTGLSVFFDRIFIINTVKENVLKVLFDFHDQTDVWFINDKVDETKQLLSRFTFLRPVLKVSPNIEFSQYTTSGLPYFQTLKEIQEYVTR